MAAEDRLIGSDLVVEFLPDGEVTPITITGDQTAFSDSRKLDTVDVTAGNEQSRYFKGTIESLDFTLDIFDADQEYLSEIKPRAIGQLTIYKRGVGSGLPIIQFNALFTGYDEDYPFDGALEISITGVRLGDMISDIGDVQ